MQPRPRALACSEVCPVAATGGFDTGSNSPHQHATSFKGYPLAGRVPEHIIRQIAASSDIIGLISRYCKLQQRGKKFWALCPFHTEKTPSFSVDPEQGLYYCFGCKEGGNVFTFLKKVEGLEFYDALQMLAREAGVDLSQYQAEPGPSRQELDQLLQANELAATFYSRCLQKAKGSERARDYLKQRRISEESVARWRIGYAPEGWEHFLDCARGRGLKPSVLEAAGLVVARQGAEGYYDRFRDRLMFPVRDRNGRVIGFGARALSDQEGEVKYLNSPEGPLFSKGRCFYGFCEAREAVRASQTAVIVEGYTDVIMAHQFGVEPVMAVLGTALTEHHARTLAALCERIVLVFDADEAGQKSASRSIEVLLAQDLDVRVATLEAGQDPCDFLLAHGADAFRERLQGSEDFLAFRLRLARKAYDVATVSGRSKVFDDLAELALKVNNEARRDMLIRQIAGELGIAERSAWAYLERVWSRQRAVAGPGAPGPAEDGRLSADEAVLCELLGLLLVNADLQQRACGEMEADVLRECPGWELVEKLLERCRAEGVVTAGEFIHALDDPQAIARASQAVAEEERRREVVTTHTPAQRYEALCDYLEERLTEKRKQELLHTVAGGGAPVTSTTTQGPSREVRDEDEQLRIYQELRRSQDRKAARLNPRKEG